MQVLPSAWLLPTHRRTDHRARLAAQHGGGLQAGPREALRAVGVPLRLARVPVQRGVPRLQHPPHALHLGRLRLQRRRDGPQRQRARVVRRRLQQRMVMQPR